MLVIVIFGVETSGLGGDVERFAVLGVSDTEVDFELRPRFVCGGLALPNFAVVGKDACPKNALIRGAENLFVGVRSLSCSRKFHGIFNLFVKNFDGLIYIAGFLHGNAIELEVGGSDVGIVGVQVSHEFEGCASADADIGESEGGQVHRVDRFDDEGGDCVAYFHVFFEFEEIFLKDLADVGDLVTGGMVREGGRNARVEGDDERCIRQSVEDCWSDGDAKVSKEAITEVGMDFYGIFVQLELERFDGLIRGLPDDGMDVVVGEVVRDVGGIGGCQECCKCRTVRWERGRI